MNDQTAVLDVARRVREAMQANGGDRAEAIMDVADELAPDRPAAVRDLWASGFGAFAVERAASRIQQTAPVYMSDDPPPSEPEELPENWGTSRWDTIDPLELPTAIGNTGERKKWGELTRADLEIMAEFRTRSGKTLVRQGRALRSIALKVQDDQTLRAALPALDRTERAVIEEITRVPFTERAASAAA